MHLYLTGAITNWRAIRIQFPGTSAPTPHHELAYPSAYGRN